MKTRLEKMRETKAARAEQYEAQTVVIDKDWKILRCDQRSWEIQFKGKFQGYYGSIPSALQALPSKMLTEEAKGTLKDVLETHKAIQVRIQMAFSGA